MCDVKSGKFTFKTDHFSTYVFADATENTSTDDSTSASTDGSTNASTDTTTKTGDSAPIVPMMAVAAVSVAAVVVSRKKKTVEE